MKKWFITMSALFLFAALVPQASAKTVEEQSGQPLGTIQIIKFEWHNGLFVKHIEQLSFGNSEVLKNLTEVIETQMQKALEEKKKVVYQPKESEKANSNVVQRQTEKVVVPKDNKNDISTNKQNNTNVPETTVPRETNQTAPAPQEKPTEVKEKPVTPTSQVSSFEQQVVELTNAERAKVGLNPLEMYSPLMAAAKAKSQDMANLGYFSHTSPTYGSPFDQMRAAGIQYKAAGENIAQGQRTPEQVVNAWMNSPGHRANILNPNFTHIGVGFVENGYYWTQQFIQM